MKMARIRLPARRKSVEPTPISEPMDIVQRDDGMFAIGFHDDAPGPFQSRRHARDVWLKSCDATQSHA